MIGDHLEVVGLKLAVIMGNHVVHGPAVTGEEKVVIGRMANSPVYERA